MILTTHCEFRLRNGRCKTCLWKKYMLVYLHRQKQGKKNFDFLHCPFEPPAKQHRPVSQLGWILWCMLVRHSKGQCRNSKNFSPLLLTVKVDQNIFFPETCFASTISEPEFAVCLEIKRYHKKKFIFNEFSSAQFSKVKNNLGSPCT